MAKTEKQKIKLLVLKDIFERYTDEEHALSTKDIMFYLEQKRIPVERKTVYDDVKALNDDYEFEILKDGKSQYKHIDRTFELSELKMLIDSVQTSKFITEKKSLDIIAKLETLCSQYEAQQLRRQVIVANRPKTDNTSVFRTLDTINSAIANNKQVGFKYFSRNRSKRKQYRRNGEQYIVNPFALIYTDGNYYLVGQEPNEENIRHYRLDRMEAVAELPFEREGHEQFNDTMLSNYTKFTFSMYGGKLVNTTLRFSNRLVDVVLDRFGQDVMIHADGADHFTVSVDIAISEQFYGWVFGLGKAVQIVSPQSVVDGYTQMLDGVRGRYEGD